MRWRYVRSGKNWPNPNIGAALRRGRLRIRKQANRCRGFISRRENPMSALMDPLFSWRPLPSFVRGRAVAGRWRGGWFCGRTAVRRQSTKRNSKLCEMRLKGISKPLRLKFPNSERRPGRVIGPAASCRSVRYACARCCMRRRFRWRFPCSCSLLRGSPEFRFRAA